MRSCILIELHLFVTIIDVRARISLRIRFRHVNDKKPGLNVLYSTPECYLQALQMAENVTWPLKDEDDFFPYAHDQHSYWTGYYTSRSNLKYMIRKANNLLQASSQQRCGTRDGSWLLRLRRTEQIVGLRV